MLGWEFLESPWFAYLALPAAIFAARVIDVALGTMRIIFISHGHKVLAPLMGFVEVTVWLLAIGQIMRNLSNPLCYLAYGAGFAMGNYVGLVIEERLATGLVAVRVVTQRKTTRLPDVLRDAGYGVTKIDAEGMAGPVTILYAVLRRKELARVIDLINRHNPKAFYSAEPVRMVSGGTYPVTLVGQTFLSRLKRPWRMGK